MDISNRGLELIYSFEGRHKKLSDGRYKAYLDTLAEPNVWTIYAGLTKGVHEGMIVTEEEGERMFRKELAVCEDAVEQLVRVDLNQNQFDALVSFAYNCGVGALRKSTLLELLNERKYETVPAQLARWVHAGGVPYRGLVRRRAAEGALFLEPMPEDEPVVVADAAEETPAPAMPQRVEEAAPPVTSAIKESVTLRGLAVSLISSVTYGITQAYDWIVSVAQDAGPQITELKTTITPFDPLLKLTPTVMIVLVIAGLAVAASRKISDHVKGKAV